MSAFRCALILVAALANLTRLEAAPISMVGWTDQSPSQYGGAHLQYVDFFHHVSREVPSHFDLVVDEDARSLQVNSWDVYNDDKTLLVYSLSPQTFQLEPVPGDTFLQGLFGGTRVSYFPVGRLPGGGRGVFIDFQPAIIFDQPVVPEFPEVRPWRLFSLQAATPEPASALMFGGASLGLLIIRRVKMCAQLLEHV